MQIPKVSVCVITYNQQDYIEQCLNGIISQKTDFEFEIVIGEDCSTDNTAKLISQIASANQNIRVLDNSNNLGVLPNFIRTLKECAGKYIAFCEGDDYWIDEYKLQKQVDYLEQNFQFGGVCTNNRWYIENDNTIIDSVLESGEISFEDLSDSNKINSQTILFRSELIQDLDWMKPLKIGDWALHLMITNQKPYYRLPEITTVYRVHEGGVHSLLKEELKLRNRIDVLVAVLNGMELTETRKKLLRSSIRNLLKKLISYYPEEVNIYRKQYFEYGGRLFNKTLLKSYIK